MVRWRYTLVLALLLLLPVKTGGKMEDDEEEEKLSAGDPGPNADAEAPKHVDESDEDDDDDDDDDDEDQPEKNREQPVVSGRRAPAAFPTTTKLPLPPAAVSIVARAEKKRPLECFVCAYKNETPMRSCLDPTKFRVHTLTCHNPDDKCFTSIMTSKHNAYETVVRGCRSNCVGTPDTTCCETNRCNNQALAMPMPPPKALVAHRSKADKTIQPTVLFFVTILLVLQTVVRVAIV